MKIKINRDKLNKSIKNVVLLFILFIIFIYLNKRFSFFIPCPIHLIFKIHCPGCGITRMFLNIIDLNFYKAFRCNPFVFILLPFFIWYYTLYYCNWLQDKEFKINNKIWYILLVLAIIFMIMRNIPTFSFLAPN